MLLVCTGVVRLHINDVISNSPIANATRSEWFGLLISLQQCRVHTTSVHWGITYGVGIIMLQDGSALVMMLFSAFELGTKSICRQPDPLEETRSS